MEKIVKKFRSFAEQEAHEIEFWQKLSGDKKLEILEIIRANYWAMNNETAGREKIVKILNGSRNIPQNTINSEK